MLPLREMPDRKYFDSNREYNEYFRRYWSTRRKKQREYMRAYRRRKRLLLIHRQGV